MLTDEGNDLANWPNQSLKLFGSLRLLDQLRFHLNARVLWDFQGNEDALAAIEEAVSGTADETAVASSLERVDGVGAYEYDFRLNASLSYKMKSGGRFQVFAHNLLGGNRNKRYGYNNGTDRPAPRLVRFVEEPRVFGLRFEYEF